MKMRSTFFAPARSRHALPSWSNVRLQHLPPGAKGGAAANGLGTAADRATPRRAAKPTLPSAGSSSSTRRTSWTATSRHGAPQCPLRSPLSRGALSPRRTLSEKTPATSPAPTARRASGSRTAAPSAAMSATAQRVGRSPTLDAMRRGARRLRARSSSGRRLQSVVPQHPLHAQRAHR